MIFIILINYKEFGIKETCKGYLFCNFSDVFTIWAASAPLLARTSRSGNQLLTTRRVVVQRTASLSSSSSDRTRMAGNTGNQAGYGSTTTTEGTIGSASSAFAPYQRASGNATDDEDEMMQPPTMTNVVAPLPTTARPTARRGPGSARGLNGDDTSTLLAPQPDPADDSRCFPHFFNHSRNASRFAAPLVPLLVFIVVAMAVFWYSSGLPDLVLHHGNDHSTKGTGVAPANVGNNVRVVGSAPPFEAVSRSSLEYAAPTEGLWSILDKALFSPETMLLSSSSTIEPQLAKPFPTGAFWTNLVMNMKSAALPLSEAVVAEPYAFKWGPHDGLQASYPSVRRTTSPKVVKDYFYPDLTFSCTEGITQRQVLQYDTLSVHIRFIHIPTSEVRRSKTSESDSWFDTFLVPGSPYITLEYQNLTPILTALSTFTSLECVTDSASDNGLCEKFVDKETGMHGIEGVQFTIVAQEGLRWLVFASEPISLVLGDARRYLQAASPFTGVLRFAHLPNNAAPMGSTAQRLITHAPVYPTSGRCVTEYHISTSKAGNFSNISSQAADVAVVRFIFQTKTWRVVGNRMGAREGSDELLMMALPHHMDAINESQNTPYSDNTMVILTSTSDSFDGTYLCIKGDMTAIVGNSWSYIERLGDHSLDGNPDRKILNPYMAEVIKVKAAQDITYVIPTATDIYGFGKEIARMAQLVHITDALGDETRKLAALQILGNSLDAFFQRCAITDDRLIYDSDLGGVISSYGLRDAQADFGNGRYSDHHFHYGYIIYAAVILGRNNSTFIAVHQDKVNALVSDIVNEDPESSFFPVSRHKSFYGGHSWASGLFPQANGKSQESSSEAINAYYAASLWCSLVQETKLHNFARLLLAMEIRSTKKYWYVLLLISNRESQLYN